MSVIRKTIQLGSFINPHRLNLLFCSNAITRNILGNHIRNYSATENMPPSEKMEEILKKKFPKAKKIIVNDISGGCGSMFEIFVETIEFKGLSLVKQHMLINQTLKNEIKDMHGLTVKTKIADAEAS